MSDQVEIRLSKTVINEGNNFTAQIDFRDRNTAASFLPVTVDYKIYNLTKEEVVLDWTSRAPSASISLFLAASLTDLDENASVDQRMELLVASNRGLNTQAMGRAHYKIRNIKGYG